MPLAMITGVSGQDGSYLAEHLLAAGYRVMGTTRNTSKAIEIMRERFPKSNLELVEWDPRDGAKVVNILKEYRPEQVYNFAAYSSGAGMFDDSEGIGDVNGLAVTRILEAIRQVDRKIRFCQASSSEMFGDAHVSPQNEESEFRPRSPYGAAKQYAHSMIRIFRQQYDLFACSAILFNHESPLRGLNFVSRKIASQAVKIKLGLSDELSLGNLDARRDWGFAGDYVKGMWLMLQQDAPDDYVFATGETHSVREMCDCAFSILGLSYKKFVREDPQAYRAAEKKQLVGDASKARRQLGWRPEVSFPELIDKMIQAEISLQST